ncbi:MAG: tetratricopeptide repeat protein [Hyphomicrobiaceae bacterium]|nr:tetratricopeptide repeat protein [Hyphomicrobiaceae bacterium]
MLNDRYDNPISTTSAAARDAYVAAVDQLLSANVDPEASFRKAIEADDGFALAHIGLARTVQVFGRGSEVKVPLARALELAPGTTPREQSHIAIFERMLTGKGAEALALTREHIKTWPRDAFALAPSTSVFGLIGFSGLAGREKDQLALLEPLADVYGNDWWYRSLLAFAEMEVGLTDRAHRNIEASMAAFPRNGHGAHIRAHLYYEVGERRDGLAFLKAWARDYPRKAHIHCHVSWHQALWAMELGHSDDAWAIYRESLHPGAAWGPQINVLTDCASFLFRAELAGEPRKAELWQDLSAYARKWFPNPGLAFADVHAALAHAMAGDGEALAQIAEAPKGAAAEVVGPIAKAFGAFAREDWAGTIAALEPHMAEHERIGGSRAQRDLVEYALTGALMRAGRAVEAGRLIRAHRPQNERNGGFPLKEMRQVA